MGDLLENWALIRHLHRGEGLSQRAVIADYVDGLLARWPDIGSDAEVDSPWSTRCWVKRLVL
jgi:hypothetical protein